MQEIATSIGTTLAYVGITILMGLLTWYLIMKIKISYYDLKEHKEYDKWKKENNDNREMDSK